MIETGNIPERAAPGQYILMDKCNDAMGEIKAQKNSEKILSDHEIAKLLQLLIGYAHDYEHADESFKKKTTATTGFNRVLGLLQKALTKYGVSLSDVNDYV